MSAAALAPSGPVFGVARSVTGREWVLREAPEGLAAALARRLDAPEALGRILAARGVGLAEAEDFLAPSLRASFPDPSAFADMDAAAQALEEAIQENRRIAVFADYDVDGATSAAQLIRYLRARGREALLYVPDRIAEGYGPSAEAFATLKARGAEVVVTVDCGATAHAPLEAARDMGLAVIVVDHHQMAGPPPPALAVVNPNRPDCRSGCGHLAAAGVTFVLLAAVNRLARARGAFTNEAEPDLRTFLDLTALGTFCDVMPLIGVNRAFAAQGLKVMSARSNPGLAALAEVGRAPGAATAYTAGFIFGPRINAGGRVGQADLGAQLLSSDDPAFCRRIALALDCLNTQRRAIEQAVFEDAVAQLEADRANDGARLLVAAGQDWHPGVIGVVAGRLKERYGRPVFVVALPGPEGGLAKGSGRSTEGVDLGGAVAAARAAGLLAAGGGHAMAAGLSIAPARIGELQPFLADHISLAGAPAPRRLAIDALLSPSGANRALADTIARAGPFGPGNPEPVFAVGALRLAGRREVGTGHLKATFEDAAGRRLEAIAFRAGDTGLGAALERPDARWAVAFKLRAGKGLFVDLQIEDVAAL